MDTLGLLEECLQVVRDLGYEIREEPLGELAGGGCVVGGRRVFLVNLEHGPADRLDQLLRMLAATPEAAELPKSRLLASRLARLANE
jgi:hypothetical protein